MIIMIFMTTTISSIKNMKNRLHGSDLLVSPVQAVFLCFLSRNQCILVNIYKYGIPAVYLIG